MSLLKTWRLMLHDFDMKHRKIWGTLHWPVNPFIPNAKYQLTKFLYCSFCTLNVSFKKISAIHNTFIKFVYVEQPFCKPFPVGKGNTWQIKIDPGKSGSNFNLLFVVFSHSKRILRSQNMMKVLIQGNVKNNFVFYGNASVPNVFYRRGAKTQRTASVARI